MPAFDQCHDQVVRALEKDGWTVLRAPYNLATADRTVFIDLLLSRGTNGRREEIIVAEVKCFPDEDSTTRELYTSIGQYLVYRAVLAELQVPYNLYLAVPESSFSDIFDSAVMRVISETSIKMVVISLDEERIVKWLP